MFCSSQQSNILLISKAKVKSLKGFFNPLHIKIRNTWKGLHPLPLSPPREGRFLRMNITIDQSLKKQMKKMVSFTYFFFFFCFVFELQKKCEFFYFMLIYAIRSERSYCALSENGIVYRVLTYTFGRYCKLKFRKNPDSAKLGIYRANISDLQLRTLQILPFSDSAH